MSIFRQMLIVCLACGILSGCQVANVDVRHAKTDKGYLNSRLSDLGELFIWNRDTGFVRQIATINLSQIRGNDKFNVLEARSIQGVGLGVELSSAARASVEARIQSDSSLSLTNAQVVSFKNTFSDLSGEINRLVSVGEDVGELWFLDEAVQPSSPLRYLLIYRAVTADSTRLSLGSNAVAGGKISVPTGWGGSVSVQVSGFGDSEFAGQGVTTLVDYYIIKPFLGRNPDGTTTYKFRIDTEIPAELVLSPLLRHL